MTPLLLRLLRRFHTYAGLLTFVHLSVYGIVGLTIPFLRQSPANAPVIRYRSFDVPPNLTDRQVAGRICSMLGLSLATPVNNAAIQHDAANNLFLDFWHANGRDQVTVLEKQGRLRIETVRNSLPLYLFTLHETTAAFHSGDWRMQLWGDYNEFAMWCLLGIIVSGFAMFLTARLQSRLAQISLAAGCCLFGAMYQKLRAIHFATALFSLVFLLAFVIGAVEFAHRKWGAPGETSTTETRQLSPGITDARILARSWRGELSSIEQSPGGLKFRVTTSLGKAFEVSYSSLTGETKVKTTIPSFLRTFAWIHVSRGIWASGSVLVSLALITLGVSGLYLWFHNRRERWIGVALIVGEAGIALGLILSMRLG